MTIKAALDRCGGNFMQAYKDIYNRLEDAIIIERCEYCAEPLEDGVCYSCNPEELEAK